MFEGEVLWGVEGVKNHAFAFLFERLILVLAGMKRLWIQMRLRTETNVV